jgi:hypothetical protein
LQDHLTRKIIRFHIRSHSSFTALCLLRMAFKAVPRRYSREPNRLVEDKITGKKFLKFFSIRSLSGIPPCSSGLRSMVSKRTETLIGSRISTGTLRRIEVGFYFLLRSECVPVLFQELFTSYNISGLPSGRDCCTVSDTISPRHYFGKTQYLQAIRSVRPLHNQMQI